MSQPVYKLLLGFEWDLFQETGVFLGSSLDYADGFIHLSTADQVVETARLHYKNKGEIALVEFDGADFGDQLIYETSRGGQSFPHQFGALKRDQVRRYWTLNDLGNGAYSFPSEFN